MAYFRNLKEYLRQARAFRQAGGVRMSWVTLGRYFRHWKRSMHTGVSPVRDQQPWITFPALEFLECALRPDMRVFEWGAGGSTLYFLKRAGQLVTVEHDQEWHRQVEIAAGGRFASQWQSHCLPPVPDPRAGQLDPANPAAYISSAETFRGWSFRDYVRSIDGFPDAYFDFILIDGRARPSCVAHATRKLAIGGHLMLDNAERPHYRQAQQALDGASWTRRNFAGPGPYTPVFWQTSVWTKPGLTSNKSVR